MRTPPRIGRLAPAALVALALAAQADAMVLCVTRKGVVVAAERCRKRETPLAAQELGFVSVPGSPGPAGPAGPDGAPIARTFHVVDANGNPACAPIAFSGGLVQCVLEPDPAVGPVQLVLHPDGRDETPPTVYYVTPGCAGPPLLPESATPLARGKMIGTRLYFSTTSTRTTVAAGSVEQVDAQCLNGTRLPHGSCCRDYTPPVEVMVSAAGAVELPTLGITPPLRMEDE